jgi:DNA-directed RNA polymerase subunit RPC12/RpoP
LEFVAIAFVFGLATGTIGKLKGSSFWIWFLIGLGLPGIGIFAALLYRRERDEPRRRCPRCGNVVALSDQVCMRCGRDLEFPAGNAA